ncbi:hypothetical protein ACIRON_23840 [Nocardioides sp. NPDC101246]|uniref:hypothetical protein n=1 Tax=Nocardioides sp. NPDC101246 TaxID=3364336 RepID=UPI00380E9190
MTGDLERAVEAARTELEASDYTDQEAWTALQRAERRLAAARREPWAEPIDLGVDWDAGAPLPHLVSNRSKVVLICYAYVEDPQWDGTYATVVTPADTSPATLIEFTFEGCYSTRFGGPNDEVLRGHPLDNRGLEAYRPHLVHNSPWISEEERINSVHANHRRGWHQRLNHYFFVFHDEVFEALAESVSVRSVRATIAEALARAAHEIVVE